MLKRTLQVTLNTPLRSFLHIKRCFGTKKSQGAQNIGDYFTQLGSIPDPELH